MVIGPSHAGLAAHLINGGSLAVLASADPACPSWSEFGAVRPDEVDGVLVEYRGSPEDDAGLVEEVRCRFPQATVLMAVDCGDPHRVADAVRSGCDVIVPLDELDAAAVLGAAGHPETTVVLPRAAASALARAWPPSEDLLLSPREREVLGLLAARMTNLQIASELFISRETVKTHVANLLRKLRADDRREVVDRARRIGLL